MVLLSLRLVHALAFVLIMPATAPILMRWFSARELPLMNSLHMTFFILGIGIGTFASGPLSSAIGWQSTLMVIRGGYVGGWGGVGGLWQGAAALR